MITPCLDAGTERQPDGHVCYLWGLAPGTAYKIDDDRREHVEVPIRKEQAKAATYTYTLRFIGTQTVAVFTLKGEEYAQPLPAGPGLPPRKRRPAAPAPRPAARRAPPARDGAPAPRAAPRGSQGPSRKAPKRVRRVSYADLDL